MSGYYGFGSIELAFERTDKRKKDLHDPLLGIGTTNMLMLVFERQGLLMDALKDIYEKTNSIFWKT